MEPIQDHLSLSCTLGSQASEMTFRNTLPSSWAGRCTYLPMKMEQSVPKRHFRRRGITQKKAYNMYSILVVVNKHNTARVASCWFIIYYRLVMHGNSNIYKKS